MKHLKKFNESKEFTDEVRDFCEENLAYLLDDDYHIECSNKRINSDNLIKINLYRYRGNYFNWIDVKNDFLPFLELLKSKYTLVKPYKMDGIKFHKKADITFDTLNGLLRYESKFLIEEEDNAIRNKNLKGIFIFIMN